MYRSCEWRADNQKAASQHVLGRMARDGRPVEITKAWSANLINISINQYLSILEYSLLLSIYREQAGTDILPTCCSNCNRRTPFKCCLANAWHSALVQSSAGDYDLTITITGAVLYLFQTMQRACHVSWYVVSTLLSHRTNAHNSINIQCRCRTSGFAFIHRLPFFTVPTLNNTWGK